MDIESTPSGSNLAGELKVEGAAYGLDLVGVAAAGPADSAPRYRAWLDAGMHADMAYLERHAVLRGYPEHLLQGCRSVVAVAMSYRTSVHPSWRHLDEDRVWISRYAWGRDYHKVLKRKLIRLGRWLSDRRPDAAWRACVDTAPILEREWAARAGLGWVGKNAMLINRHLGSELFLGCLLTDIEMEYDSPKSPRCGGCTACLDACPTGALVAPGVLDSRRCIAYLTIERRRPMTDDQRRLLGRHAAGCDICNEVCPYTRRAPTCGHVEFEPAPHRLAPRLDELKGLSEEEWRTWRQGSALTRVPFNTLRETLQEIESSATSASPGL